MMWSGFSTMLMHDTTKNLEPGVSGGGYKPVCSVDRALASMLGRNNEPLVMLMSFSKTLPQS